MSDKNQLRVYANALQEDLIHHNGRAKDPSNLTLRVVDFTNHHARTLYSYLFPPPPEPARDVKAEVDWAFSKLKAPWREIAGLHVRVIVGLKGWDTKKMEEEDLTGLDLLSCHEWQTELRDMVSVLLKWMVRTGQEVFWALPMLQNACRDSYEVARLADRALILSGRPPAKLREATKLLRECLTDCVSDKAPDAMQSRKMAVYFIANLALKALLKVGNVDGCEKVVVAVVTKAAALAAFSQYPKSDQTGWNYYRGRVAFERGQWGEAEKFLTEAVQVCHKAAPNRQAILHSLVPVFLVRGVLPSKDDLTSKKYSIVRALYDDRFLNAFKLGDLRAFDNWASNNVRRHQVLGTSAVVQHLRWVCKRNLIKRAWVLEGKPQELALATVALYVKVAEGGQGVADVGEAGRFCRFMKRHGWLNGEVEADKVVLEFLPFTWFAPVRELHGDAKARRDAAEEAECVKFPDEGLLARVGAGG